MFGNMILGSVWFGGTGTSFFMALRRIIGTSFVELTKKFNSLVNIVINTSDT
jgi:hypothetical protein